MRARWTLVALVISLAATSTAVLVATPRMAPVKECPPARFWHAACSVTLPGRDCSSGFGGMYPPRDGYFICYSQGFHGQSIFRVKEHTAMSDFPEVVRQLDRDLREWGPRTHALRGYQAWRSDRKGPSDARGLLAKTREARLSSARRRYFGIYRHRVDAEEQFDRRWQFVKRYPLNVLFELTYLNGMILFAFWPWLRRHKPWRRRLHLALLPLLLMLPYFLGYASLTYTSAGPSGGVLYPWLIVWFRIDGWRWPTLLTQLLTPSFDYALLDLLPKPLVHLSQPLGPMLSLSGWGAPGLIAVLLCGAVIYLAPSGPRRLLRAWRARRTPSDPDFPRSAKAAQEPGAGRQRPLSFYGRKALKPVVGVLAAVLILALLAKLSALRFRVVLMRACDGQTERVRKALAIRPGLLHARTANGYSLLHAAIESRSHELTDLLLDEGADVNAKACDESTLLHWAAKSYEIKVLQALLERGADVNAQDGLGETPLHRATTAEAAQMLARRGAGLHATTSDGWTALHAAAGRGGDAVIEVLLTEGADLHARDKWGDTPLHKAAWRGDREAIHCLLERGAEANARADDGWTPLHCAVRCYSEKAITLLVERGADVDATTEEGATPLDLVSPTRTKQEEPISDLLRQHGARTSQELGQQ